MLLYYILHATYYILIRLHTTILLYYCYTTQALTDLLFFICYYTTYYILHTTYYTRLHTTILLLYYYTTAILHRRWPTYCSRSASGSRAELGRISTLGLPCMPRSWASPNLSGRTRRWTSISDTWPGLGRATDHLLLMNYYPLLTTH